MRIPNVLGACAVAVATVTALAAPAAATPKTTTRYYVHYSDCHAVSVQLQHDGAVIVKNCTRPNSTATYTLSYYYPS